MKHGIIWQTPLVGLAMRTADLKAVLLIRAGVIEERTRRLQSALTFYTKRSRW